MIFLLAITPTSRVLAVAVAMVLLFILIKPVKPKSLLLISVIAITTRFILWTWIKPIMYMCSGRRITRVAISFVMLFITGQMADSLFQNSTKLSTLCSGPPPGAGVWV